MMSTSLSQQIIYQLTLSVEYLGLSNLRTFGYANSTRYLRVRMAPKQDPLLLPFHPKLPFTLSSQKDQLIGIKNGFDFLGIL